MQTTCCTQEEKSLHDEAGFLISVLTLGFQYYEGASLLITCSEAGYVPDYRSTGTTSQRSRRSILWKIHHRPQVGEFSR